MSHSYELPDKFYNTIIADFCVRYHLSRSHRQGFIRVLGDTIIEDCFGEIVLYDGMEMVLCATARNCKQYYVDTVFRLAQGCTIPIVLWRPSVDRTYGEAYPDCCPSCGAPY